MMTYTTISGDTWDSIAYKVLGDGFLMDKMIAENPLLADMFVFPAGVTVIVPDINGRMARGDFPAWFNR